MKLIKLLAHSIKELSGESLVKAVVNFPTKEGFTMSDQRSRFKVLDALDNAKLLESGDKELLLEESEYAILKDCVSNMRWAILDKAIIAFEESVLGAETPKV